MCLCFLLDSWLFRDVCVCVEGGGVVSLYDLVFMLVGEGWGGYLLEENCFEIIPQTENRKVFKNRLSHFCLLV